MSCGTVQPISIRQQVQWGGMCSTLHQSEGWASAEATHIQTQELAPTNIVSLPQHALMSRKIKTQTLLEPLQHEVAHLIFSAGFKAAQPHPCY